MRLFLALALPENVRGTLAKVQAELRQRCPAKASWVAIQNLHVTLKFLGEVPQTEVANLCRALAQVRIEEAMRLRVAGIECFPPRGAVHAIVAGISGDVERLCSVQEEIETGCAALGFVREKRAYVPHVTLARIKSRLTGGEWLAGYNLPPGPEFSAGGFVLMESELSSHGATYHQVAGFGADAQTQPFDGE